MKIKLFNSFKIDYCQINESMAIAKKILKDYSVTETDSNFIEIKDILNPNFGYLPLFVKFKFRDRISIPRIQRMVSLIRIYRNLLTSKKIDPNTYDNFEQLDDAISTAIIRNEDLKFAKSFISNKYSHLLDDANIKLFGELRNFESSHKRIQMLLAKKLAAFKTADELGMALKQLISSFAGNFDADTKEVQVIENNGHVVYKSKKELIARIPYFKVCKALGSSSWCISRDASYFNSYASKYKRQFIYWDFTKQSHDRYSQIGITVDMNNIVTACHDKFDNYYYDNKHILKNIPKVDKSEILFMYEQGLRVAKDVQKSFGISDGEIKAINPFYFAKLSDYKEFEDIKNFIKISKTIVRDEYLKILNDLVDNDETDKAVELLAIKPIRNIELLAKISGKTEDFKGDLNAIDFIKFCFTIFRKEKKTDIDDLYKIIDKNKKLIGFKTGRVEYASLCAEIRNSTLKTEDSTDADVILLATNIFSECSKYRILASTDILLFSVKHTRKMSDYTPIFEELFKDISKNRNAIKMMMAYVNGRLNITYGYNNHLNQKWLIFKDIVDDDILSQLHSLCGYIYNDIIKKYLELHTDRKCPKLFAKYNEIRYLPIFVVAKHVILLNDTKMFTKFVRERYSNMFMSPRKIGKEDKALIDLLSQNKELCRLIIAKLITYDITYYANIIGELVHQSGLEEADFTKTAYAKMQKNKIC